MKCVSVCSLTLMFSILKLCIYLKCTAAFTRCPVRFTAAPIRLRVSPGTIRFNVRYSHCRCCSFILFAFVVVAVAVVLFPLFVAFPCISSRVRLFTVNGTTSIVETNRLLVFSHQRFRAIESSHRITAD